MGCRVTAGVSNTCADLLKGSGLAKRFWATYNSMLDTPISLAQTADISSIDFGSYGGFYLFETGKFASDFTWNMVLASGGNKSFDQVFSTKLTPGSTTEDLNMQKLLIGDDIIIMAEDMNQEFYILGAGNGLTGSEGSGGSGGKESGGDLADVIVLKGNEKTKYLRFATAGGYTTTLAYIRSLEL